MERYFILDKFNTWYDWGLILTKKEITPAKPKVKYVDIGGMSGSLDLTESLTGEVTYENRTISASFWTDTGSRKDRDVLLHRIITALHGKKIKVIEPDDPDHYYNGRVTIKSQANSLPYLEFTIEINCDPWRYALEDTVRQIYVNGDSIDAVIYNHGVKTLLPVIAIAGDVSLTHNGVTTSLPEGSYKVSDIKLYQGDNIIEVSGNGSVTFTYREADI